MLYNFFKKVVERFFFSELDIKGARLLFMKERQIYIIRTTLFMFATIEVIT